MHNTAIVKFAKYSLASMFVFALGCSASAQQTATNLNTNTIPESYECTQLSIDDVDETLLTKSEILERMDENLKTSIDKYQHCVAKVQQGLAAGGGGAGGGAGDGSGQENAEGEQASEAQEVEQNAQEQTPETEITNSEERPPIPESAGARQGVVAPKDNDSIICKLLYDEIQNAPQDKVAGFEKQYRDYKCGK